MPHPARVVVGDLVSVASDLARGASEPQSALRKPIAMARRTTPKVAISTSGIAGSVFIPAIPRAAAPAGVLDYHSRLLPHLISVVIGVSRASNSARHFSTASSSLSSRSKRHVSVPKKTTHVSPRCPDELNYIFVLLWKGPIIQGIAAAVCDGSRLKRGPAWPKSSGPRHGA